MAFIENVEGVLEDEYFDKTTDGMKGLVSPVPNELTRFKANVAITRGDIKRQSIANALGGDAAKAEITTNEDTHEEANHQNSFQLACIGTKEATTKEITDRTENSITNPILHHPDSFRMKEANEWDLHKLVKVVMEEAERPDPIETRRQLAGVMGYTFNWRETAMTNMERLTTGIAKADAFGIKIRNSIKLTIILANVVTTARSSRGGHRSQGGVAQGKGGVYV